MERFELLMLFAAIVAMLARRLRIPYTVGLVLAGGLLTLFHVAPAVALTPDLVFNGLLPPLIFEAALFMPWRKVARQAPLVGAFATVGVVLAAAGVALGLHALRWSWQAAWLFGALMAATDPVAVIAMFRERGMAGRLRLVMESESLINDGTAAVLFTLVLSTVAGEPLTLAAACTRLAVTVLGGVACGALVSLVMSALAGRSRDHLLVMTFSMVTAYASFLAAEHIGASGVIAAMVAGGVQASQMRALPVRSQQALHDFWEYVAFVDNSLIFLLIGVKIAARSFADLGLMPIWVIGLVLAGRALAIYPVSLAFAGSRWRVPLREQGLLVWGGLRGALSLALALGLPVGLAYRDDIIDLTFAVVAFSVVVQGLTMPLLAKQQA